MLEDHILLYQAIYYHLLSPDPNLDHCRLAGDKMGSAVLRSCLERVPGSWALAVGFGFSLGFRGLGFWGLGFWGLVFRGLGFWGLGFWGLGV